MNQRAYQSNLSREESATLSTPTKKLAALLVLSALTVTALPLVQAQQAPAPRAKPAPSQAHVLSNPELDQLLAQPDKLLIIDVRRPDEVTTIGGFPVYLSIQLKDLEQSVAWIPRDRTIVTVSNHAARAGKAADFLASKGFKVAGAAGAQTYEKDGGTHLLHIAPQPPEGAAGGKPVAAAN